MAVFEKNGRWWIDYYNPFTHKRIRKPVSKEKRVAELKLRKIQLELEKRQDLEALGIQTPSMEAQDPSICIEEFVSKYLKYCESHDTQTHFRAKERCLKEYILPLFGRIRLDKVSVEDIEDFKQSLLQKGYSPASVNRNLAYLKHFFNYAIHLGKLMKNPVKGVRWLKEPPGRLRYLSKKEIDKLLDNASGELRQFVVISLNTGMRRGEILNLKWSDLDFENRMILIQSSKSNEKAVLPMNSVVYDTLSKMKKKDSCVFTIGKSVSKKFKQLCNKLGIENIHLHDLRHTFASYLAMNGCNLITIQRLLRHKTLSMVIRYSHLSRAHLEEAVEKLYH